MKFQILFFFLSLTISYTLKAQHEEFNQDTTLTKVIKPNWNHGDELIYKFKRTHLLTNERDMPLSVDTDSLYAQVLVHYKADKRLLSLVTFTRYDIPSNTPYLQSSELLFMDTLWLEFDTTFSFIGLNNWQKWRDILYAEFRRDRDSGKIDLRIYGELRKKFANQKEVENLVLYPYLDFLSVTGQEIVLWKHIPKKILLENPYTKIIEEYEGTDFYYYISEKPNHILRQNSIETEAKDYPKLAKDYKNYLKATSSSSGSAINIPDPRIKLKKEYYQYFNVLNSHLDYFRSEQFVEVNGAREYLEYTLLLISVREKQLPIIKSK